MAFVTFSSAPRRRWRRGFRGPYPNADEYAYDVSGNITLYRHTPADPQSRAWSREYTYSPNSNRLETTTLTLDGAGPVEVRYPHDARGNMVHLPHLHEMAWNHRDQLRRADRTKRGNGPTPTDDIPDRTNPVLMHYDLRGQRVRKLSQSGQVTRDRVYVGGFEIYRESTPSELRVERTTLHITDGDQRLAILERRTGGSDDFDVDLTRFQHDNHLGSACVELDADGTPLSYEEYHPYGTTALHQLRARTAAKRYRYTSMERDDETGLSFHFARYFAGWLCRWISPDPVAPRVFLLSPRRDSVSAAWTPFWSGDVGGGILAA
jgi:RHS repeat-associated protein